MSRKLKIFWANYDGRRKVLCATTSMKRFKELTGMTGNPQDWIAESGNLYDIETALSAPEKVFIANYVNRGDGDTSWHLRDS